MIRITLPGVLSLLIGVALFQSDQPAEPSQDDQGPVSEACADALHQINATYMQSERHGPGPGEALEAVREARERFQDEVSRCTGLLIQHQAHLLGHFAEYQESLRVIDSFFEDGYAAYMLLHNQIRMRRQRGFMLERLGRQAKAAREYVAAAGMVHDSLDLLESVGAFRDAAITYQILNNPERANEYYAAAEALVYDSLALDSSSVYLNGLLGSIQSTRASTLRSYAINLPDGERKREAAREVLRLASSALEKVKAAGFLSDTGVQPARIAYPYHHMAWAERALGNLDQSEAYLDEALPYAQEAADLLNNRILFGSHIAYAEVARRRGQPDRALRYAREALDLVEMAEDPQDTADALEVIGFIHESRGNMEEAVTQYERALAIREVQRERLRLHDWSASAFAAMQTPYRGLIRIHLRRGNSEEAFRLLDRIQARHLRDLRAGIRLRESLSEDGQKDVDSLLTRLEEARLAHLDPSAGTIERSRLRAVIADLQSALRERTLDATPTPDSIDIPRIQESLAEDGRTLLAYFLDEEVSTAFVMRADTFAAVRLPATPASVDSLMQAVGSPWRGPSGDPAFSLPPLAALYDQLVRSVDPLLSEDAPLTIIPDRETSALPFGALLTGPAEDYAIAPFLVRRHPIAYELAPSLLAEPDSSSAHLPLNLVAAGRTNFEDLPEAWGGSASLSDLPGVSREIRQLTHHVENAWTALNDEATEHAVRQRLRDARILHVASHAEADAELPLYSRILLSDDNDEHGSGADEDGILHLYELQQSLGDRQAPLDLVVLSGCSTGRGRHLNGEGMMSLQYGARAAGVRSTLATLWPIDDDASADLMERFYAHLRDGLSKDRALQRAQIDYLDAHEGLAASPYFWSAAVLSGSALPVPLSEPGAPWWAWLLSGAALLSTLVWGVRRLRTA